MASRSSQAFFKFKYFSVEFSKGAIQKTKTNLRSLWSKADQEWAEAGRHRDRFLSKITPD